MIRNANAFLAIKKIKGDINNYRDLAGKKVATVKDSTSVGALQKIGADNTPMQSAKDSTAHMWLDNPFKGKGASWWHNIFATHPPIEQRIAALRALKM